MSTVFAGPSRAATRIGLAIGLPAAVAGWFLLPVLLPALYSGQFEDAIGPARILLLAAVVHLALAWAKTFLPAIGRPGLQTAYEVAFAVLLIAGMALLASFESTGAAIAVSFTYVATQVPLYFVANRLLDEAERLPPEDRASGLASRNPSRRLPMSGVWLSSRRRRPDCAELHYIARAVQPCHDSRPLGLRSADE